MESIELIATHRYFVFAITSVLLASVFDARADERAICRIQVVDSETSWPVPLVELRTTHQARFVSDNAGVIAFDLPELLGRETWFTVNADGYEVPADGFGNRGVRLTPQLGETFTVKVNRTSIAKRLGRITGGGLFAESQKLAAELDWPESGVVGCDSVQNAVHRGRLFWAWGDTSLARYPLGIFHMTSATSSVQPLDSFEPPVRLALEYFRDDSGRPRGVAQMPGSAPTWLTGYVSLPDESGKSRLVATYFKIKPPLEAYECGLCVWNDEMERFEPLRAVWKKSDGPSKHPPIPQGHPIIVDGDGGDKWVLFGDPLPKLRCRATFDAWQDPKSWEVLKPQDHLQPAGGDATVTPHTGSIAWSAYRKRYVTVFMQKFGKPSAFGELWYAEADSPYGPWGRAETVAREGISLL